MDVSSVEEGTGALSGLPRGFWTPLPPPPGISGGVYSERFGFSSTNLYNKYGCVYRYSLNGLRKY